MLLHEDLINTWDAVHREPEVAIFPSFYCFIVVLKLEFEGLAFISRNLLNIIGTHSRL